MKHNIVSSPALGLTIELDSDQIIPDDPGQGTPAMVILRDCCNGSEIDCGTYWCAVSERELSHEGTPLTPFQVYWLESKREEVEDFIELHTP